MFRNKAFACYFCTVLLIATTGCISPRDYSFEPLLVGPPVSGVTLGKGDFVKIQKKSSDPINLEITYVSVGSEKIYGWLVPDGQLPWMVAKSKRVVEIVDFDDIESIQISKIDPGKIAKDIGKGILFYLVFFALIVFSI